MQTTQEKANSSYLDRLRAKELNDNRLKDEPKPIEDNKDVQDRPEDNRL